MNQHQLDYDHSMQDEYILEVQSLEHPSFPPPPRHVESNTELEKAADETHATVVIEEPVPQFQWKNLGAHLRSVPSKMKGGLDKRLPIPPLIELFWSWLGAFLGILSVSVLNEWLSPEINLPLLEGSFGASAVLIFAVTESKLSQPRNFIGGQVLSAIVGVTCRLIIHQTWICAPIGMSLSLLFMQLTSTTHPPGGATALIAATVDVVPKWAGYSFVLTVLWGSVVMQLVALIVNNLNPRRQYPTYWW